MNHFSHLLHHCFELEWMYLLNVINNSHHRTHCSMNKNWFPRKEIKKLFLQVFYASSHAQQHVLFLCTIFCCYWKCMPFLSYIHTLNAAWVTISYRIRESNPTGLAIYNSQFIGQILLHFNIHWIKIKNDSLPNPQLQQHFK